MSWEYLDYMTLRWPDTIWHIIPGLIIYQILGTARHELAHALAFKLYGWKVTRLFITPHIYQGSFYWGRCMAEVQGGARHSSHIHLAPYEACALSLLCWGVVARTWPPPWTLNDRLAWNLWAAFTAMFLISPVVDTVYNLWNCLRHKRGDFWRAAQLWDKY
ncbi:MAG TPA: hypothetical protein VLT59_15165 [Steroidobacteraceae bacterium]|nr:hypothetical protein [Steroidobacteraceae bacterium]